jgi:hypothetical protein
MTYRFITVLIPGLSPIEVHHDLFDYTVFGLKWCYDVLQFYSDLHLPTNLSNALSVCFRDMVGLAIIRMIVQYLQAFRRTSFSELKASTISSIFLFSKNFSIVQKELQKEEDKMEEDLTRELKDPKRKRTLALPKKGRTSKSLLADLKKRGAKENKKWEEGLVSGAVYCGEEEVRRQFGRDKQSANCNLQTAICKLQSAIICNLQFQYTVL